MEVNFCNEIANLTAKFELYEFLYHILVMSKNEVIFTYVRERIYNEED